jgi:pre-mRNA-splicing factor CWC26
MAQYILEKKVHDYPQESSGQLRPSKPLYKGPAAPANRFGIMPGYRWDAIVRGNGFEHKVLLKKSERSSIREDDYRWSSSDM